MSTKGETGEIEGGNMDEEGSKREVEKSLHASTKNNTAESSGEGRKTKVARTLKQETQRNEITVTQKHQCPICAGR